MLQTSNPKWQRTAQQLSAKSSATVGKIIVANLQYGWGHVQKCIALYKKVFQRPVDVMM